MSKPLIVEDWFNKPVTTGPQMDWAIAHTIQMIGPGYLACLVCDVPTPSRGVYMPLDHNEDLGNGAHFEGMMRIFSFALCDDCNNMASEDDRETVRDHLKKAVEASMKDNPETIQ